MEEKNIFVVWNKKDRIYCIGEDFEDVSKLLVKFSSVSNGETLEVAEMSYELDLITKRVNLRPVKK